jgi:hypothetical protein
MIQNDKPRVIVKNKNLQFIFDYCLESKTPFTANPRLSGDEWEIEFKITDIMGAVALGMFLRENRIEPVGIQVIKPQPVAAVAKAKVTKTKKQESEITEPTFAAATQPTATQPIFAETPTAETGNVASEEIEEVELETEQEIEAVETGGFSPEMLFDEN